MLNKCYLPVLSPNEIYSMLTIKQNPEPKPTILRGLISNIRNSAETRQNCIFTPLSLSELAQATWFKAHLEQSKMSFDWFQLNSHHQEQIGKIYSACTAMQVKGNKYHQYQPLSLSSQAAETLTGKKAAPLLPPVFSLNYHTYFSRRALLRQRVQRDIDKTLHDRFCKLPLAKHSEFVTILANMRVAAGEPASRVCNNHQIPANHPLTESLERVAVRGKRRERVLQGEHCAKVAMEAGISRSGKAMIELQIAAATGEKAAALAKKNRHCEEIAREIGIPVRGEAMKQLQIAAAKEGDVGRQAELGVNCTSLATRYGVNYPEALNELYMRAVNGVAGQRVRRGEYFDRVASEHGIPWDCEARRALRRLSPNWLD